MENQTVTTVEEIIEESISLSSAKEAYELPTNYKASYELEKGLRIRFEEENKKLRRENRKVKELKEELEKQTILAVNYETIIIEQDRKIAFLEREKEQLSKELEEEKTIRVTEKHKLTKRAFDLDRENRQLTDNLTKLQNQCNNLNESNIALRKAVVFHSSRTTFLYLSIFFGVAAVAELVGIVLLLNR